MHRYYVVNNHVADIENTTCMVVGYLFHNLHNLDIHKAFDPMDHAITLQNLAHRGFHLFTIHWIKLYFNIKLSPSKL